MKLFAYCLREFDEKPFFDRLCQEFDAEYAYTTAYPTKENVSLAAGYDAVSVTPCDMSGDMIQRFYDLGIRYISTRSIGYDHIDVRHAKSLGMQICHVSYAPDTVADYTIMLMLMSCRNICHILERTHIQDFTLKGKMGRDLCDCTVGIIGTGQIGKTVARRLAGFGCRILAYDLFPGKGLESIVEYVTLEQLYRECDLITLHAPATAENYHLLNEEAFASMKENVIIINTARGTLIDTDALIQALEKRRVSAAALDVLEQENGLYYINHMGNPITNRQLAVLRSFPNVILTPHTAFYTEKVVYDMAYKTFKGIHDMMNQIENPLVL